MKTIRNIKQLKAEQKRLHARQTELGERMVDSWQKIKTGIQPQHAGKGHVAGLIGKWMINQLIGKVLVQGGIALGASWLSRALIRKAVKIFN